MVASPTIAPADGTEVARGLSRPAYRRIRVGELVPALSAGLACAVPVTLLALAVRTADHAVIRADARILEAATELTRRTPRLWDALVSWQWLTQPLRVNVACTVLCVWAWRRWGMTSRPLWAFGTLMTVWGGQFLAKLLVARARPVMEDALAHAAGYSFPSGHAANTTGAVAVVLILTWPVLRATEARVAAVATGVAVVLATAADRVLLGVHHPSDVIAGVLTGLGVVAASWLAPPRSRVLGKRCR